MEQRLQKILSNYGIASRRKAEQMILERRVRVIGYCQKLLSIIPRHKESPVRLLQKICGKTLS